MTGFILDNSVAMRWCFEPGNHAYADGVARLLARPGGRAMVPMLWHYEVSSVLARSLGRGMLARAAMELFLAYLVRLPIEIDADSGRRVLTDVHPLAIAHRLTSYDAAYLELALRRGLPLAKLDVDLLRACRTAGVDPLDPFAAVR